MHKAQHKLRAGVRSLSHKQLNHMWLLMGEATTPFTTREEAAMAAPMIDTTSSAATGWLQRRAATDPDVAARVAATAVRAAATTACDEQAALLSQAAAFTGLPECVLSIEAHAADRKERYNALEQRRREVVKGVVAILGADNSLMVFKAWLSHSCTPDQVVRRTAIAAALSRGRALLEDMEEDYPALWEEALRLAHAYVAKSQVRRPVHKRRR